MHKILLIEDDAALQDAYQFILKTKGYKVDQALNGKEGLELASKTTYDVILLDLHMPIMNGMDFLRTYQKPSQTKIIVFSNMIEPSIEKEALGLGADHCILKSSWTPVTMLSFLEDLLAVA